MRGDRPICIRNVVDKLRRTSRGRILWASIYSQITHVRARKGSLLVLLVDDEPDQIEMYQLALELAAFEVIAAFNGAEAIASARDRQPDAIVLDVRLPDMSGWMVCDALKRDTKTASIPIVILTAAVSPTLSHQAAAAGTAACLLKPCFPDELARTVRQVLAPYTQA